MKKCKLSLLMPVFLMSAGVSWSLYAGSEYEIRVLSPGVMPEVKYGIDGIEFSFDKKDYFAPEKPVLTWKIDGKTKTSFISGGVGSVEQSGSVSINNPNYGVNEFTLSTSYPGVNETRIASFNYHEFGLGDITLSFDDSTFYEGGKSPVLSWNVGGRPKTIEINNGIGSVGQSGSATIQSPVAGLNTYSLTATAPEGQKTSSASFNYVPYSIGSVSISFDKANYVDTDKPVLTWSVGGYASDISIDKGVGKVDKAGSRTLNVGSSGINTYSITVSTPKETKTVSASYTLGKSFYSSCLDVKQFFGDAAKNGVYQIDPDGPSGANAPFNVYCDMNIEGGGWTLAYKQSNYGSGILYGNAAGSAGSAPYLSPEFNATTTSGSLTYVVPGTEYMFYSNDAQYVILNGRLQSSISTANCSGKNCVNMQTFTKKSVGFPALTGLKLSMVYDNRASGILFGYSNTQYTDQPWCSPYFGRYDGGCVGGGKRQGNWLMFIR